MSGAERRVLVERLDAIAARLDPAPYDWGKREPITQDVMDAATLREAARALEGRS